MKKNQLIVFDSGIGGVSILRHLQGLSLPITYYADQKYFPYGDRGEAWLAAHLSTIWQDFALTSPLGLVIACNTATVSAVALARQYLTCPVIGIEPVTKPIAQYKHPVVWGTAATIQSARAQDLRTTHGRHIRYYHPAGLAEAIEFQDQPALHSILDRAQHELGQPDAIGLSCTHYPLITLLIEQHFPSAVIIDPGPAVAAQVKKLILPSLEPGIRNLISSLNFVSSQSSVRLKQLAKLYL